MDLVEFLTARVDEDEAAARGRRMVREHYREPCPLCAHPMGGDGNGHNDGTMRIVHLDGYRDCVLTKEDWLSFFDGGPTEGAARSLHEVEAKRAILAHHGGYHSCLDPEFFPLGDDMYDETRPCEVARFLAAVYADHPDYREDWRV